MNFSDDSVTVNFQATRLMPSKAKVVYYIDNHLSSNNVQFERDKDVLTKSICLQSKSLLILRWFSD